MTTSLYGDLTGDCGEIPCTAPDGLVQAIDYIIPIDCFVSAPNAPIKPRCDLDPALPDLQIFIVDILETIKAFVGLPYRFDPAPFPCEEP